MSIKSSSQSREKLKNTKSLIKDMKSGSPNLKSLAESFEMYQLSKSSSPLIPDDTEHDLYINYLMAIGLYNFEVNDFITIAYWLTKNNYLLQPSLLSKLNQSITSMAESITTQNWVKLLNVYSNIGEVRNLESFYVLMIKLESINIPKESIIQVSFDLCKLQVYNPELWASILRQPIEQSQSDLHSLRVIKLAMEVEGKGLLSKEIPLKVQSLIARVFKEDSSDVGKRFLGVNSLAVSKLHREADYVLKLLMAYEENYNVLDTYVVNFYNESERIGFDLHGPLHYFHPDLGNKHEQVTEDRLIGALKMKKRLLSKSGFRIASVPYYEWNRYVDQTEKLLYFKRKLRLLRNL